MLNLIEAGFSNAFSPKKDGSPAPLRKGLKEGRNYAKKGAILFIAIGMIMVVSILVIVILRIISNQARLTHHQVSRIQAQYAAKAGINYALEKLRRNDDPNWPTDKNGRYTRYMCRSASSGPNCGNPNFVFIEPDLPNSIQEVDITVYQSPASASKNGPRKVSAKAIYTLQ